MADAFLLVVEGLESLGDVERLPAQVATRARQAVNHAVKKSRTEAGKEIRAQVAFPARYLTGSKGRLRVDKFASNKDLEAVLTGRDRPTSLARFATSRNVKASRKRGVKVEVAPGEVQTMKRAFLMRLRGDNLGLAIRLRPGETVRNKKFMKKVSNGLYLLYGPAVNQVFSGVAEDRETKTLDILQAEFTRLMGVDG